jgi:hypothetical protein
MNGTELLEVEQRDRDILWGIYKRGPRTAPQVATALFAGNIALARKRIRKLRLQGLLVTRAEHLPPKGKAPNEWRSGGRKPYLHEVTKAALELICPEHGEPIPAQWTPRWGMK